MKHLSQFVEKQYVSLSLAHHVYYKFPYSVIQSSMTDNFLTDTEKC